MDLVAEVALLMSKELVSIDDVLGRKSILGTIDSLGRGTLSEITDGFYCWCSREVLMAGNTCLDPVVGQKLTTTYANTTLSCTKVNKLKL